MAAWICDDGSYHSSGCLVLCTDGFTKVEVEILANSLNIKWGLETRYEKKKTNFRLVIKTRSMPTVVSMCKPHMHPYMWYKLGLAKVDLID